MIDKIDVLDHGYVRLVDNMGSDLSVVRSARVSYDAEPRGDGSDEKLIKYLMKNEHSTPFESVTFTFEVKAPLFVVAQWQRHRTWSYNQVSARYTELAEEFYVPDIDKIGVQSKNNKQGRTFDTSLNSVETSVYYSESCELSFGAYRTLIANGWPRELARCVLPLSTYTRMFATVNLWNLLRFITLRDDEHAQWEIQQYAKALAEFAYMAAPVCMKAFRLDES